MPKPTKALVAGGVLLVAAGVLAWQISRQFGSGGSVLSASSAASEEATEASPTSDGPVRRRRAMPNMGEGDRMMIPGGGRNGDDFQWSSEDSSPEEMEARMASMRLNSATPSNDDMDFEAFDADVADVKLLDEAFAASLTSGEWAEVIGSWRTFVRPLIEGDAPAFTAAIAELGGSETGAANLFGRLSGYLHGAAVAWEASRIRQANIDGGPDLPALPNMPGMSERSLPEGAVPMMAMMTETDDDDGNSMSLHTVNMPLLGIFPQLNDAPNSTRYYEIWTPARLEGSKSDKADLGLSVFLARIDNRWTPAAVRLGLRSEAANSQFRSAMQEARAQRREHVQQAEDDTQGGGD